ncbi:MAG: hypothetical protein KIT33_09810 [Candidatus Kapabacteria bacterium]|nr:hypothetical protein [Ignavibacteriota bacterium]MCW5885252.1 hypothetical protein [Candidatus Kapabacteria bacterium]
MNSIYLRYGNYNDGTLEYVTAVEFKPTILRPLQFVSRTNGRDLRDILYTHVKSVRTKSYEMVLSSNDLVVSSKLTFIKNFLKADVTQYNLTNTNWDTQAVTVTLDGTDPVQFEYLNNHKGLIKLKLDLIQKYPD